MAGGKFMAQILRESGQVPGFVGADEDHDEYRARAQRDRDEAKANETEQAATSSIQPV